MYSPFSYSPVGIGWVVSQGKFASTWGHIVEDVSEMISQERVPSRSSTHWRLMGAFCRTVWASRRLTTMLMTTVAAHSKQRSLTKKSMSQHSQSETEFQCYYESSTELPWATKVQKKRYAIAHSNFNSSRLTGHEPQFEGVSRESFSSGCTSAEPDHRQRRAVERHNKWPIDI